MKFGEYVEMTNKDSYRIRIQASNFVVSKEEAKQYFWNREIIRITNKIGIELVTIR